MLSETDSKFVFFCHVVIKHQGKGKRIEQMIVRRPNKDTIDQFRSLIGEPVDNLSLDNPLNTDVYKKKLLSGEDVTSFCFFSDSIQQVMFSGYGDGLICAWDVNTLVPGEDDYGSAPMIGHTNKINHLEAVSEIRRVFSCSNDCTLRQWSIESLGVCERIFKF